MGPYYDTALLSAWGAPPRTHPEDAAMNRTASATDPTRDAARPSVLLLPLDLIRGLHRAIRRWHWRGARPFVHLNDHLRRDVGLAPLDERNRTS